MKEKYDITVSDGIAGAKPKVVAKKKNSRESYWFYLGAVGQIGYAVAIPLVLGAIAGYVFDQRSGTKPVATFIGLGIGAAVSVIGFARTIKKLL